MRDFVGGDEVLNPVEFLALFEGGAPQTQELLGSEGQVAV
jgi:hypothetical protein